MGLNWQYLIRLVVVVLEELHQEMHHFLLRQLPQMYSTNTNKQQSKVRQVSS